MSATPPEKTRITLSTRLSFEDAATLRGKASGAGLTTSAFLRQAGLAAEVKPRPLIPEINQEQWRDLGRLGGNINQIAFRLNDGGEVDANLGTLLDETLRLLGAVRATLIGLEAQDGLPH
jgi:hypothetical protein